MELYRTTLGAHVASLISCINSGTLDASDAEELFSPGSKPADGTPPFDETGRSDWVTSWASASPLELLTVNEASNHLLVATYRGGNGLGYRLRFGGETQPPHRIRSVNGTPVVLLDVREGERSPSETAIWAAFHRAAHLAYDAPPHVFEDSLAREFIGPALQKMLDGPPSAPRGPHTWGLSTITRSRYCEDALGEAASRGINQYVILGAGLDSFAYRSSIDVTVYEIDHPATQRWKQRKLGEMGIETPDRLRHVPVDFEVGTLHHHLEAAGFRFDAASFFSCLGVVYYLTANAWQETLSVIAECKSSCELVFDYWDPRLENDEARQISQQVALLDEPVLTRTSAAEVDAALERCGFSEVKHMTPREATKKYFAGRPDGLAPGDVYVVAHALRGR